MCSRAVCGACGYVCSLHAVPCPVSCCVRDPLCVIRLCRDCECVNKNYTLQGLQRIGGSWFEKSRSYLPSLAPTVTFQQFQGTVGHAPVGHRLSHVPVPFVGCFSARTVLFRRVFLIRGRSVSRYSLQGSRVFTSSRWRHADLHKEVVTWRVRVFARCLRCPVCWPACRPCLSCVFLLFSAVSDTL